MSYVFDWCGSRLQRTCCLVKVLITVGNIGEWCKGQCPHVSDSQQCANSSGVNVRAAFPIWRSCVYLVVYGEWRRGNDGSWDCARSLCWMAFGLKRSLKLSKGQPDSFARVCPAAQCTGIHPPQNTRSTQWTPVKPGCASRMWIPHPGRHLQTYTVDAQLRQPPSLVRASLLAVPDESGWFTKPCLTMPSSRNKAKPGWGCHNSRTGHPTKPMSNVAGCSTNLAG